MGHFAVITAAGRGRRMGGSNKLLLELDGVPILVHTVRRFQASSHIQAIALSAPPEQVAQYHDLMRHHRLSKVVWVVAGGSERQYSITNVLQAMAERLSPEDLVMIHDGARPLVDEALLERLIEGARRAEGVLPVTPVKDTIKKVIEGRVAETLDRSQLFAAQTPQTFRFGPILAAHRRALADNFLGTDDASLIEWMGGSVVTVEGKATNLKVTTPDDLVLLRAFLEAESVGR